jgi:hypothetical protein
VLDPVSCSMPGRVQLRGHLLLGPQLRLVRADHRQQDEPEQVVFRTPQGKDIDGLVRLYHEHHLAVAGGGAGMGSLGGEHGVSAAGGLAQYKGGPSGAFQAKGSVSFSSQ